MQCRKSACQNGKESERKRERQNCSALVLIAFVENRFSAPVTAAATAVSMLCEQDFLMCYVNARFSFSVFCRILTAAAATAKSEDCMYGIRCARERK